MVGDDGVRGGHVRTSECRWLCGVGGGGGGEGGSYTGCVADRAREIRVLPPLLVNQIAAGEVVERPASVVKELVDNALDAGAGAVCVELEQGGIDLIRVSDDGCGIAPEQLPLALAPHATSKVREAADLERIGTMGFRGEALASIASVARVTIRSRAREGDGAGAGVEAGAAEIEAEGDRVTGPKPASGPVGTSVGVRTLFFNTPARRKFLKTPATEQGRCLDVVKDAAMAHCAIAFTVVADGRTVLDLPPGQSPRERLIAVLGKELAGELIEVSGECEGRGLGAVGAVSAARDAALDQPMTVWGLVGRPSIARATAQAQHVFLNGRPIRDRTVMHAIKEAFRGLVDPGRHPTAALLLEMHPGAVDVNVHPTKTEVRFRESNRVHSLVLRSVREALRAADLTPVAREFGQPAGGGWAGGREILPGTGAGSESAGGGGVAGRLSAAEFAEGFRRLGGGGGGENGRLTYEALRAAIGDVGPSVPRAPMPSMGSAPDEPRLPMGPAAPVKPVVQVHSAYLVTQDEQGMVVIDQHALHERVMFEKLSARLMRGRGAPGGGEPEESVANLESQRLLSPAVVPASPSQVDGLDGLMPLLTRIGIDATPVGPTSIAVQSFPTLLLERGVEPGPFVAELLERAEGAGFVPGSEEALHEVLDMMACKAAVKAGDRLSDAELGELLALRERVERASSCPHGRPTSIRVTIKELEKRFGRV